MKCKTCGLWYDADGLLYCPRCGSVSVSGLELAFACGCLLTIVLGLFVFARIVIFYIAGN